jgi:autotransporter-associated beta strand protein
MTSQKTSHTLRDKNHTRKLRHRVRTRKLRVEQLEDRRVLASMLYVDTTDIGGTDPNQAKFTTDGQPAVTGLTLGGDIFTTIGAAISAAQSGDTILVADGTYTEDVVVDRQLILSGANAGIAAGVDPGTRGLESVINGGFRLLAGSSGSTVDGFKVVGGLTNFSGIGNKTAFWLPNSSNSQTIKNNILQGPGGGTTNADLPCGIIDEFAYGTNNSGTLIQDNEIFDWRHGIYNQGSSSIQIVGNNIHSNSWNGVANDFVDEVLIQGNRIANNGTSPNGEGVGFFSSNSHGTTGNDGIPDVVLRSNVITGNVIGVAHYGGDAIDAAANWWGTDNADMIRDSLFGSVTFSPFLTTAADTSPVPGFQGDESQLGVAGPAADGVADSFKIQLNGANLEIYFNDVLATAIPFASLTSLIVEGSDDDDTLTVDFSGGNPIPSDGLFFNGAGQATAAGDSLIIAGNTTPFDTFTVNHTGSVDDGFEGNIVIDDGNVTRTIHYTGLEPINAGNATNIIFNLPATDDVMTLANAGGGQFTLDVTSGTAETVTMNYPTASGSLTINMGDGNDTLTVTSPLAFNSNTNLVINGQDGNDTVNLNAPGGLAVTGNLSIAAETIAQTNRVTVTGSTTLVATTAGTVTLTIASNDFIGPVSVVSSSNTRLRDTNSLSLGSLSATNSVSLQAGGAVTQLAGTAISAAGLRLLGTGPYTLLNGTNSVGTFAASTDQPISFRNANALAIGTVLGTNGITTSNDEVTIRAGGAVTINRQVSLGTGRLTLRSAGATQANPAGNILTSGLRLLGSGAFTLTNAGNTFTTLAASLADGPGSIDLQVAGNLTIGSIGTISGIATGNPLAGGDVTINAPNGTITVSQPVSTATGTGGGVVLTGSVLVNNTLTTGSGNIELNGTLTGDLTINAGIDASGPVLLQASDDLLINADVVATDYIELYADCDVIINATVQTTDGADIFVTGDINENGTGGVRVLPAGMIDSDGSVFVMGSDLCSTVGPVDSVVIDADGTNNQVQAVGDVFIDSSLSAPPTADVIINGRVQTTGSGSDVTISATNDAVFGASGDLTTADGDIFVLAGNDISMSDGTVFNAGSGKIDLYADAGDIALGSLVTTDNTASAVTISAPLGAVIDGGDADVDIVANSGGVVIEAAAGVGHGNAIETSVTWLDVVNDGSGDIEIDQVSAGGNLDVVQATQAGDSGSIWIRTARGNIRLVGAGTGVRLTDSDNTDGTVTLRARVVTPTQEPGRGNVVPNRPVTSQGGDINLIADADVRGGVAGIITSNGGNITITADANNVGPAGDRGTIQLSGNIAAGTGTVTFSLADCDGWVGATTGSASGNVTAGNIVMGNDAKPNGEGALRLQGNNNTFTGTTTVVEGTLIVNGVLSGPSVIVEAGGVLGGNGNGSTTGVINATVTVQAGGTLDPGDVSAGCTSLPGRLTVNDNVVLEENAIFRVQLNDLPAGTGYDQLRVNGTVDLSGDETGAGGAILTGTIGGIRGAGGGRVPDHRQRRRGSW